RDPHRACSCLADRGAPPPPPFPYTTLFRSERHPGRDRLAERRPHGPRGAGAEHQVRQPAVRGEPGVVPDHRRQPGRDRLLDHQRSEEHTSELQSQSNLVCRLLLEKKKTRPDQQDPAPHSLAPHVTPLLPASTRTCPHARYSARRTAPSPRDLTPLVRSRTSMDDAS